MNAPGADAPATPARWQRAADRAARAAWPILVASVALALVGGVVTTAWNPETAEPEPTVAECEDPPCFGGGGLPGASDLPTVVPFLGYGLAIVLGLPSLVVGAWDVLRGRWAAAGRRLLMFGGPALFLVGTEIVPHLASPCLPSELGVGALPTVCERAEQGADVKGRWHALDHALVGALPMVMVYRLALRRWRPDVAQWRRT